MERTELFRSDLFKKSNVGTTKQRDDALNQMKAIHASQNRVRASGRNR